MRVPLPGGPRLNLRGNNGGLLFGRFFSEWSDDWTVGGSQKTKWLTTFEESWGDAGLIEERAVRLAVLIESQKGMWTVVKTLSRFVTGLGDLHPVENGFRWHHELGAPYLPGSSLKGLIAPTLRGSEDDADPDSDQEGGVDRFIVYPMLPTRPVKLEVDVLTSHYGGWDPANPPADWRDPTPVPFLTVAPGQPFIVGIAPRPGVNLPEGALDRVLELLVNEGVGAKTSVGYGRFAPDEAETEKLRRVIVQEGGSREERYRVELQAMAESQVYELALKVIRGEAGDIDDPVAWVRALKEVGYLDAWRQGKKLTNDSGMRTGKKKLLDCAEALERILAANGD